MAVSLATIVAAGSAAGAETSQRFPPPDFESSYRPPPLEQPPPRAGAMQYADAAALLAAMGFGAYFLLRRRSRFGVAAVSLASLAYFGFYRHGCVCSVGAVQNVALGLADGSFPVPWPVVFFFAVPLLFSLFFGRVFCGAACPLGAIQDIVLLRPVRVPRWLDAALSTVPYIYLALAVLLAATGSMFAVCRYDPFVPFFRLAGPLNMFLAGAAFIMAGVFVGRPYCRYLCPYGAILSLTSRLTWKKVTVTPDECVTCRLCDEACPYGCISGPVEAAEDGRRLSGAGRLAAAALLLAVFPLASAAAGWFAGPGLARMNRAVALADKLAAAEAGESGGDEEVMAFRSSGADPMTLRLRAAEVESRFRWGTAAAAGLCALAIALKFAWSARKVRKTEYEVDQSACLSCGRCYKYCPVERLRWKEGGGQVGDVSGGRAS